MATADIIRIGKESLTTIESLLNKKSESVISVNKEGKEWKVQVEVLERRAVPDSQDLIGRYQLKLDENGELLGYKQVLTKRRGDIMLEEE